MKREAIATGATIELARKNAIEELGINLEDSSIELVTEIIDQPEKKKFGIFGGKDAKVKVYFEISPAAKAEEYLRGIITSMGVTEFEIKTEETSDGAVFTLEGKNLGIVIGRRGETLDSIQYLVGLVANKVNNSYYRITINTGNFREKRENTIENLAKKTALRSIKIGKNIAFEPMNPYERRIIHTAVQDVEGAKSWSIGENQTRHVVVGPEGVNENQEGEVTANISRSNSRYPRNNQRNSGYRGGYNKGGYNNRNRDRTPREKRDYAPKQSVSAQSNDSAKAPAQSGNIVDVNRESRKPSVPLYGKIDAKKPD